MIRRGIVGADWGLVCEGFGAMTGTSLDPPEQTQAEDGYNTDRRLLEQLQTLLSRHLETGPSTISPEAAPEETEPEPEPESEPEPEPEPEPADDAAARGRELAAAKKTGRIDVEQFRVPPPSPKQQDRGDGKRECRKLPWEPPVNKFKPDPKALARDARVSRALSKVMDPHENRKPAQLVSVECGRCHKKEQVEPIFVPRRIERDDDGTSSYICGKCIQGGRR